MVPHTTYHSISVKDLSQPEPQSGRNTHLTHSSVFSAEEELGLVNPASLFK